MPVAQQMGVLRRVISWIEIGLAGLFAGGAVLIICWWIIAEGYKGPHGGHIALIPAVFSGMLAIPFCCGGLGLRYLRLPEALLAHVPLLGLLTVCGLVVLTR